MNPAAKFKKTRTSLTVLLIVTRLNVGGVARHVLRLAKDLAGLGYRVTVATGQVEMHEGDMSFLAARDNIRVEKIPELGRSINWRDDWRAFRKLRRLIKSLRPDIIHTHTAKAGTLGRIAAYLSRTKLVVHTYHGHVFYGYFSPAKTQAIVWIEKILARLTDRLIVLSPSQQAELATTFKIAALQKISVVPLGFARDDVQAGEAAERPLRETLGLATDVKLVAAIGRIVAIKNPALLLQIAKLCRDVRDNVHFVFIGRGEAEQETRRLKHDLGLHKHVHFVGWRHDLANVYSQIDALLITSKNEGTPYSVIEAMTFGCPVVATRVGGVPDMIRHGETGLLFASGDAQAGAAALAEVLSDAALRAKITANARRFVQIQHGHERVVQQIDALYVNGLDL